MSETKCWCRLGDSGLDLVLPLPNLMCNSGLVVLGMRAQKCLDGNTPGEGPLQVSLAASPLPSPF